MASWYVKYLPACVCEYGGTCYNSSIAQILFELPHKISR